ncbi:MAG: fluoride efflux transporter CrcB [Acidobacteria bacterium]|nr:fluoride efflux transporter CrcB [Acidobacteriota bacterium]
MTPGGPGRVSRGFLLGDRRGRGKGTSVLILLLIVFGSLGTLTRYGLQGLIQEHTGAGFPAGTLSVNLLGCFLLGIVVRFSLQSLWISPEWRTALTLGFLGAFTTFSTFAWETVRMLEDGEWIKSAIYMGASLLGGLLGIVIGIKMADLI